MVQRIEINNFILPYLPALPLPLPYLQVIDILLSANCKLGLVSDSHGNNPLTVAVSRDSRDCVVRFTTHHHHYSRPNTHQPSPTT